MAKLGRSPAVYGIQDEAWIASASEWDVNEISAYQTIGPKRLCIAPKMLADLKAAKHGLLHLRGLWAFPSYVTLKMAKTGVPIIISPEGMLDPWALSQSVLRKRISLLLYENKNLRQAKALHALNVAELRHIREFGLHNPIAVIPNGVDTPLKLNEEDRSRDPRILLFLGRIHPKKGLAELIEAWALVLSIDPKLRQQWQIHIAGWDDGGHEAGLQHKTRQLGIDDTVKFVGSLYGQAKDRALRMASLFILPSHGEGLPISVLEAAAYGLRPLITQHCNLPELTAGGVAIQIDAEPISLARELAVQLGRDYALHRAAGETAREIVMRCFSWSKVVDQYLMLYEWVVAGGRAPSGLELC